MHLKEILQAQETLSSHLKKTPLVYSHPLSELLGREIYLKLETQNPTNSFKVRPAFMGILNNLDEAGGILVFDAFVLPF